MDLDGAPPVFIETTVSWGKTTALFLQIMIVS